MTTMNRALHLLMAASLATGLAACSSDEDFAPQSNLKDTPITVSAMVGELTTRAGYSAENLPTQFYMKIDQSGTTYDYDVLMKNENGVWVAYDAADGTTPTTLLWEGSDGVSVTAATYQSDTAPAIETDQSTADKLKANDHLYYTSSEVTPSTNGISIAFDHAMAKIDLTITLRTEFDYAENPITGITIDGITPLAVSYAKPSATYEVILAPATKEADTFTITFNVGERVFSWTSKDAVTLASGYKYTLALTAGQDKVTSATFTTTAWGIGTDGSNELTGETE